MSARFTDDYGDDAFSQRNVWGATHVWTILVRAKKSKWMRDFFFLCCIQNKDIYIYRERELKLPRHAVNGIWWLSVFSLCDHQAKWFPCGWYTFIYCCVRYDGESDWACRAFSIRWSWSKETIEKIYVQTNLFVH